MGRDFEQLRRDQEAIMVAYRAERTSSPTASVRVGRDGQGGGYGFGRVDQIVSADPLYGPHVLAVRQAWSGFPPAPADAGAGPVRCQLVPGRTIEDFSVNDLVRMICVSGAVLAEPLS